MSTAPPLDEICAGLEEVVGGFDPALLSGQAAADAVTRFSQLARLAEAGRTMAAGRVAETRAWQGAGMGSAADWLAGQAGSSVREAAETLATAKRLRGLPAVADALRAGRLSGHQAREVADAAAADPGAASRLVELAGRETFRGLRDEASRVRAAATDDAAKARRAHRRRGLSTSIDREGEWHLHVHGSAADGARFAEQHRAHTEQIFRSHRRPNPDNSRDTYDNRAYDAFLALAGIGPTATGTICGTGTSGGTDTSGGRPPTPGPRVPSGANVKVIALISHTALLRGRTVAGETCEVAGLGPVPVAAIRELLATDDPFLAAVITKGADIVNVAHHGRGLNVHQRTYLDALGGAGVRCTNCACNRTVAIQMDHRHPWDEDRVTALPNIDPLCPDCHRRKTHHGHHLEPGTGRRRLIPPATLFD